MAVNVLDDSLLSDYSSLKIILDMETDRRITFSGVDYSEIIKQKHMRFLNSGSLEKIIEKKTNSVFTPKKTKKLLNEIKNVREAHPGTRAYANKNEIMLVSPDFSIKIFPKVAVEISFSHKIYSFNRIAFFEKDYTF